MVCFGFLVLVLSFVIFSSFGNFRFYSWGGSRIKLGFIFFFLDRLCCFYFLSEGLFLGERLFIC